MLYGIDYVIEIRYIASWILIFRRFLVETCNGFIRAKIHIHLYYAFVATVYWEARQGLVFSRTAACSTACRPELSLMSLNVQHVQHARSEHVDRA